MARKYDSFATSCYLPKSPFNMSCELAPSPERTHYISSQTQPEMMKTQVNIVSLNRYLNKLRPKIAVLQMMKEKVQSANLVQKILMQKRVSSDHERGMKKRERENSVQMSRVTEKRLIEDRREYLESEKARMSQQFRRQKEQVRLKLNTQEKRVSDSNKQMYRKARNDQKLHRQRVMRCNLFKQRRAKSFYEQKLKRLESENMKRMEKIERLNEAYYNARKGSGGKVKPLERLVQEIQDGLGEMKLLHLKVEI